jgi:hypothetical protein
VGGSQYRQKQRARETEQAVADYFAVTGWEGAARIAPGRTGADVLKLPGLHVEVKARRDLRLTTWLEQAGPRLEVASVYIGAVPPLLPIVVHRPDGWGPKDPGTGMWPATMRLEHLTALLRQAGYDRYTPEGYFR